MAKIQHLLDKIRTAIYGKEVRGSLADGLEAINNETEDATEVALNVEQRQDTVEQQFDDVLAGYSEDRPISNEETIAARTNRETGENHQTLGQRLDAENKKVNAQLAQKAPQKEVDNRRAESLVSRKKTKRPTITIVDDDGKKEFYSIFFKLAQEFNIPITSAMITGFVDFPDYPSEYSFHHDYYTYEQIAEMRDSGLIEFISHSHDNISYRDSTDEEIREDIEQSQAILKHYGLNYKAIAVPFGHYDERVLGIMKEYFDYATGSARSIDEGKRIVAPPNVNNYRLGRLSGDGNRDFATIEAGMDEAIAKNGGLVLTTHVMAGNGTDEAWLRGIITTAISKGLEFVTLEECWDIHGNIAQFGGTNMQPSNIISANGNVYGNEIGTGTFNHSTSITGATPITDFKTDSVTYSRISGSRGGFPKNLSGMLETYRYAHPDGNNLWNYQRFITTREKEIFIRYWDTDTLTWTAWEPQSKVTLPEKNTFTFSTGHSAFPSGVTYSIITTLDPSFSLAPDGQRGTLVTHKITETNQRSYNYQEYHAVNGVLYKRFALNQNNWGNWYKYSGVVVS